MIDREKAEHLLSILRDAGLAVVPIETGVAMIYQGTERDREFWLEMFRKTIEAGLSK